jgi:hypothetical protein
LEVESSNSKRAKKKDTSNLKTQRANHEFPFRRPHMLVSVCKPQCPKISTHNKRTTNRGFYNFILKIKDNSIIV